MKVYKGMRAFTPDEYKGLQTILDGWISAAEKNGFMQYKTPLIDPIELYKNKTSEEILSEQTYSFVDRGGRNVLLRPEITPGTSIMIAGLKKNRNLSVPYKVFTIGSVFRYESVQKGRTREHIQFNVDIFGESSLWADAEIITTAFDSIEKVGLNKKDFIVKINDREHIENNLIKAGIKKKNIQEILHLLDKKKKISLSEFNKQLKKITNINIKKINSALKETPNSINEIKKYFPSKSNIKIEYDPNIIRGFNYYTGIIFEIYAKKENISTRSIAGGGRYDTLVESYGDEKVHAVGFGMGDVTLSNHINSKKIISNTTNTKILLCSTENASEISGYEAANSIKKEFNVSFVGYVQKKKLSELYKKADSENRLCVISYDGKKYIIRNLKTRKDTIHKNIRTILHSLQEYFI